MGQDRTTDKAVCIPKWPKLPPYQFSIELPVVLMLVVMTETKLTRDKIPLCLQRDLDLDWFEIDVHEGQLKQVIRQACLSICPILLQAVASDNLFRSLKHFNLKMKCHQEIHCPGQSKCTLQFH